MRKYDFLEFEDAREIVRKLGIKSRKEWWEYSRTSRSKNIPSYPSMTYKDKGWISWDNWFGITTNFNDINRKYTINHDYFKTWSDDMAYILGLWFSDGYIGQKNNVFSISQIIEEKALLLEILKKMGSNSPLRYIKNKYLEFSIFSKEIKRDIMGLGGKPNKSLDVKFPKIPKKYLYSFVRGLWDGDGCISYNKKIKAHTSSYTSASKEFIYKMHGVLKENIDGLRGSIFSEEYKRGEDVLGSYRKKDGKSYSLYFSINDTRRLSKFLYNSENELSIKRKKKLFISSGEVSRMFLKFNLAKEIIQNEKVHSKTQYIKFCRNRAINDLPINPNIFYKKDGWISWYDWLGKDNNMLNKKSEDCNA